LFGGTTRVLGLICDCGVVAVVVLVFLFVVWCKFIAVAIVIFYHCSPERVFPQRLEIIKT
jgi:hypothetical protein